MRCSQAVGRNVWLITAGDDEIHTYVMCYLFV